MKSLPNPGLHLARRVDKMVIDPTESGALMLWIPYKLLTEGIQWTGKHSICLAAKDGTLQQKSIANLKKVFPSWTGENPFDLEDMEVTEGDGPEFELAECYHDDSYTPAGEDEPVIQFKARWLNTLGGSTNMPEPVADRKSVLAKWGSKFKAVSAVSGKKVETKPAASKSTPAKSAAKGPPGRSNVSSAAARTLTQDEAWELLTKKHPEYATEEAQQENLAPIWFEAIKAVDGNSEDGAGFTLAQWGKVATQLGV